MTWGEIKKDIDKELEDDAEIGEIRVSELYYRGIKICFDIKRKYVILNETKEES